MMAWHPYLMIVSIYYQYSLLSVKISSQAHISGSICMFIEVYWERSTFNISGRKEFV